MNGDNGRSSATSVQRNLLQWFPVVAMIVAIVAGYVQLGDAVKANSLAIEQQAVALEKITSLLVNDVRHDEQIATLRRDLTVMWEAFQEHTRHED